MSHPYRPLPDDELPPMLATGVSEEDHSHVAAGTAIAEAEPVKLEVGSAGHEPGAAGAGDATGEDVSRAAPSSPVVDASSPEAVAALGAAAAAGDEETVVTMLLEHVDANAIDAATGATALMRASSGGHDALVRLLLDWEMPSAVGTHGGDGLTALHCSVMGRHQVVARTLVEYGADPFSEDSSGETVVKLARRIGYRDFSDELATLATERLASRGLPPVPPTAPTLDYALSTGLVVRWTQPESSVPDESARSGDASGSADGDGDRGADGGGGAASGSGAGSGAGALVRPKTASTPIVLPVTHYKLQVARAYIGRWRDVSDSITTTSFLVPDLEEGKKYVLRVCAFNPAGRSGWSASSAHMRTGVVDDAAPRMPESRSVLSRMFSSDGGAADSVVGGSASASAAAAAAGGQPRAPPRRDPFASVPSIASRGIAVSSPTSSPPPVPPRSTQGARLGASDGGASAGAGAGGAEGGTAGTTKPAASKAAKNEARARIAHARSGSSVISKMMTQALERETKRREAAEAALARMTGKRTALEELSDEQLVALERVLRHSLAEVQTLLMDRRGETPSATGSALST